MLSFSGGREPCAPLAARFGIALYGTLMSLNSLMTLKTQCTVVQ